MKDKTLYILLIFSILFLIFSIFFSIYNNQLNKDDFLKYNLSFMIKSNNSILSGELVPNFDGFLYGSYIEIPPTRVTINSDGFRDNEYSKGVITELPESFLYLSL